MKRTPLPPGLADEVARALTEDLGAGDVTAALIDESREADAQVSVEEPAILCGRAWFDEVFRQLDARIQTRWERVDGDVLVPGTVVCAVRGPARSILSGERTALNFLQTLSGTATAARRFAQTVADTAARILDTRKTIPGLRAAQKYAVRCGGGDNHRFGLFDAVLIKENHIAASGTLSMAVERARRLSPDLLIEVEVENLDELRQALDTDADRLMLDGFSLEETRQAVSLRDAHPRGRKDLEASGNMTLESVRSVAATGVDWISVGAITKHLDAVDFSMRFV